MTNREVMQQTLEALENVNPSLVCEMAHHSKKDQHGICQKCPLEIRHLETVAAIKEVLAQQPRPVQEQSCFCHDGVSLQSVSGGAAPEGYLGKVTLLIDGVLVDYVKAQPEQEPVASPYNPNPVDFQYHYPDGSWRCSNGKVRNGMHPDRARSLYALKDNT